MAADDPTPTVRAIPLRARHKLRAKKRRLEGTDVVSLPPPAEPPSPVDPMTVIERRPPAVIEPPHLFEAQALSDPPTASEEVSGETNEPDLALVFPRFRFGWVVAAAFTMSLVSCVVAFARTTARTPRRSDPSVVIAPTPAPAPEREVPDAPAEKGVSDESAPARRTAEADREEARSLLERGMLAAAITTARRAVDADPEDALAWLILGAAEMESLHDVDAAKTFRSCVQRARRGPIRECRAFVR